MIFLRSLVEVGQRLLWVGVLAMGALGLTNFVATILLHIGEPISAPQLAALSAESIATAVLPYVVARSVDEICRAWPEALRKGEEATEAKSVGTSGS